MAYSLLAILAYVWYRFEWQFAVGAVVATVHDAVTTIGVFSLFGMEFNLTTIAAILTIIGYSINDTVVIYDRVRENLRRYKTMPLPDVIDRSVNETLARTVMTSLTTVLALVALVVFGGPVVRGFTVAMIWGVVIGTYSSVYVASPMIIHFNLRREAAGNAGRGFGLTRRRIRAGAGRLDSYNRTGLVAEDLMYDYVIVGAGSAGCVMAAPAERDRRCQVLLLEAGPPDNDRYIHMPVGFYRMTTGPLTWGYHTVPLRQADDRQMIFPQGRVLGGGSSINAMVFTRGHALRLRRLGGGGGLRRLVLRRRPAVFPPLRGQRAPGERAVTAPAARWGCPTRSARTTSARPSSGRRRKRACPTTPTSTASARRAAASIR